MWTQGRFGCWLILSPAWIYDHHSCVAHYHIWWVSSAAPCNYVEKQPAITAERLSAADHCCSSITRHLFLNRVRRTVPIKHYCCFSLSLSVEMQRWHRGSSSATAAGVHRFVHSGSNSTPGWRKMLWIAQLSSAALIQHKCFFLNSKKIVTSCIFL